MSTLESMKFQVVIAEQSRSTERVLAETERVVFEISNFVRKLIATKRKPKEMKETEWRYFGWNHLLSAKTGQMRPQEAKMKFILVITFCLSHKKWLSLAEIAKIDLFAKRSIFTETFWHLLKPKFLAKSRNRGLSVDLQCRKTVL